METRPRIGAGLIAIIMVLAIPSPGTCAPPEEISRQALASSSPRLDRAAASLAEGRLGQARERFEGLAADSSQSPWIRGLAQFGLAETAVARNDTAAAIATLRQLSADTTLLRAHQNLARHRITGVRRLAQGLSAHDPAAHRTALPTIPEAAVVLHVAPDGSDAGDGSTEHPFRSLEAARNAARSWKRGHGSSVPKGSVQIIVHGGAYRVERTLELTAEDSGTAASPVVYMAAPGQQPIFDGGVRIASWIPVADGRVREQLDPAVRRHVRQADLKTVGVTDLGDPTALRQRPELFCNGVPQTLARWPNEGFVKTGDILGTDTFKVWNRLDGCHDGKFRFVEDRPTRWTDEPDVRLYGYWFWDWFEEYQQVAEIDAEARTFTLAEPYSGYGYRKDQRYFAVNVLRELDRPSEWYLDRRTSIVYWLPPENIDPTKATTVLSIFKGPHVIMEDVEHLIMQGLTFQDSRGNGVHIQGGSDNLVAGCTFRRLGGDAIDMKGGRRHGVFGCTMHTLGCGGVLVTGGDQKTLARGDHFVENCTVYDISRLKRTYTPAVRLDGCGHRVAHNLFERMPSSAMRVNGNEHLVELNIIRDVVQESDDQGGVDMFGSPLFRGVVIRWNHWSDIGAGTHCGGAGVRLDDMISGVLVHGNVFERCGAVIFGGVQIHGGKENLIDGNVFLNCFAGISFSRWSEKRWLESIERFLPQAAAPPYSTRYPDLAMLKEDANINLISRNIYAQCGPTFLRDGDVQKTTLNIVTDRPPLEMSRFADEKAIRSDPQLRRALLETIPVGDIGPYDHPWRAD
jgi:parallel beta helix pectate lyase-like protein